MNRTLYYFEYLNIEFHWIFIYNIKSILNEEHFYINFQSNVDAKYFHPLRFQNGSLNMKNKPKSAPYPRLKNSKKTSKCQVFSFTVLENRKFFEKNGPSGALKSHNAEKLKGGTLWDFPASILSQNSKKIEGGTLWGKNFRKKSLAVPKEIGRGDSLVSPGMVWYAGKQERTILVSSCGLKKKEKSL